MCGVAKEVKNLPQKSTQDELELGLGFIAHLNDIQKEMIESAKKVRRSNFKQAKIESKDAFNLWGATMQACEASVGKRIKFTVVMSARIMWFVKLEVKKDSHECTILISDGVFIGEAGFTQKLIRFIMLADDSRTINDQDYEDWRNNLWVQSNGDSEGKVDSNSNTHDSSMDPSNDPKPESDSTNEKKEDNSQKDVDEPSGSERDSGDTNYETDNKRKRNSGDGHNSLISSKMRPSNMFRTVSTDNSSSSPPIKTAESPTQIIVQSTDDQYFTNKTISPDPKAPEMGNSNTIKSIDHRNKSRRMTVEEQMMWQRAFTGLGNADMKYLDQDQYGVIIPYLCQLDGAEVKCLGEGRCGAVKKIRWNGGFAAMKEYVLQYDDERIPSDVYDHELEVFYRLKPLWGRYIPRLLFHNPWSSRPSIGMELGQPMDDDIEEWTQVDRQKLKETIAKIKEEGLKQNDLRGANFVRLDNGDIAMIDFEDVVEISSS